MLNDAEKDALERSDILIEGNTGAWEMRLEGDIHGTYVGAFRFKGFLTPLQQIAANREYRELIGANPTMTPEHESFLAYALTQLKYRIVSAPPFWSSANPSGGMPGDIADENVITAILDAAIGTEMKYKSQLKKKRLEAIERAKSAAEKLMDTKEDEEKDEADEGEDQEDSGQS